MLRPRWRWRYLIPILGAHAAAWMGIDLWRWHHTHHHPRTRIR